MTGLARNIAANLGSSVWSIALSVGLTPLYVSLLGAESFGLIGFYTTWVAVLGILDTGISATAVREMAWLAARPQEATQIPSLLRSLEIAYWAIMLAIGFVLLAGASSFGASWFGETTLSPEVIRAALMLMVVSLVAQVPSGLYVGGLLGLQRQVSSSAWLALFATIRGVGAAAVLMVQPDIRSFFLWQIAVSAVQTAVLRAVVWRYARSYAGPARFSVAMLRSVGDFAGGMTLVTVLSLIANQADKMLLSRIVPLEIFGYYMVAWTVASGLTRVATPLLQAFSPRFTELISSGNEAALAHHVRAASRLMSAMILPPTALLIVVAEPILRAWTGDPVVSTSAAPFLAVLTAGTALAACSYPALSLLYSRHRLRPVIAVNAAAVVVVLPVVVLAALRWGALGAAACWTALGAIAYVTYQLTGVRRLPNVRLSTAVLEDLIAPAGIAFAVAAGAWFAVGHLTGRVEVAGAIGIALVIGWTATLLLCRDILTQMLSAFQWSASPAS